MPAYLLFLHEDPSVFAQVSREEMQAIIQKYSSWKHMLDARLLTGGGKLQDGTGKVLRCAGGRTSVTDGPYTESKEIIGGFFHIRADEYEQAVQAASDCPHLEYGTIEILEVEPVSVSPAGEAKKHEEPELTKRAQFTGRHRCSSKGVEVFMMSKLYRVILPVATIGQAATFDRALTVGALRLMRRLR